MFYRSAREITGGPFRTHTVYQLVREDHTGPTRKAVDGEFRLEPGHVIEITVKAH